MQIWKEKNIDSPVLRIDLDILFYYAPPHQLIPKKQENDENEVYQDEDQDQQDEDERTRNEDPHLAMGSMTVPALVTTLGLIILRWAVRGTKVEPIGARMLAWVGRFL